MQENKTKANKGEKLLKFIISVCKGDFILRWGVHRKMPHILTLLAFSIASMFLSYFVDQSKNKYEQNKKVVEILKIQKTQILNELSSLNRITKVEDMLEQMDSDVKAPKKPATIIKD